MISKRDLNQTRAKSKSAQGERIFVTDKKRERKQIKIKWKNNQNNMRNDR